MDWRRRSRTHFAAFAAVLAAVVATSGAAVSATPIDIAPPPLLVKPSATIFPRTLSETKHTPISLRIGSSLSTTDDSQLPALSELRLGLDRQLRLRLQDVPLCRGVHSDVRGNGPTRTCPESIIGRGRMGVEIRFPDHAPIRQSGKLAIFRGPAKGRTARLYLLVELAAPVTGEVVVPIEVKPVADGNIHGLEGVATFPKIAGGYGSVTHLGLRFRKGIFTAAKRPHIFSRPAHSSDGNTQMTFNAGFLPSSLPKRKPAPVKVSFGAKFSALDEAPLRSVRKILIDSEAHLDRGLADIPVCPASRLAAVRADAKQCAEAIVGRGTADFASAGAARPISPEGGNLTAYNGGRKHGSQIFWLRYGTFDGEPTAVGRIAVKRLEERPYRLRLTVPVPPVAAGRGPLTSLSLQISRRGVFAAACPRQLLKFRGTAVFADASELAGTVASGCFSKSR